jgi:hypothetical protein
MESENLPSPEHWQPEEDALDDNERLTYCQNTVRVLAKDLRAILGSAPESFPNRNRVVEISNELLTLVPVLDQKFEDNDELKRKQLYADIKESARKQRRW